MKFFKDIKDNWWIIVVFLIILAFFLFCIRIKVNDESANNIRYVLSSITQGLFALLALAVTLPVIFTQLMQEKKSTMFIDTVYLVFFGISIILPLYILATTNNNEFNCWLVKLSMGFAANCVFLVIVSFLRFKKKWENKSRGK